MKSLKVMYRSDVKVITRTMHCIEIRSGKERLFRSVNALNEGYTSITNVALRAK